MLKKCKILKCTEHPNAERLIVCEVLTEDDETLDVVCGAPNVREGMTTIIATIGTNLTEDFTVKKVNLRGVDSFGMLCSERELGISDDHSGIIDLEGKEIEYYERYIGYYNNHIH